MINIQTVVFGENYYLSNEEYDCVGDNLEVVRHHNRSSMGLSVTLLSAAYSSFLHDTKSI